MAASIASTEMFVLAASALMVLSDICGSALALLVVDNVLKVRLLLFNFFFSDFSRPWVEIAEEEGVLLIVIVLPADTREMEVGMAWKVGTTIPETAGVGT